MSDLLYREANSSDVPAMARIRGSDPEGETHWNGTITAYLHREHHPRQALIQRVLYVAYDGPTLAGFIGGHLTRRYHCDGELQWINVIPEYRGKGIAQELLRLLAGWFIRQSASRICVDVDPDNSVARRFYAGQGATRLNDHWLVWEDIAALLGDPER